MHLADFLREELHLTGTHIGCEHGVCGSCTVLFDEQPVRSCIMLAVQANGHRVMTVEGMASVTDSDTNREELSNLQKAFWECHGLQCGFCTPGMLITAKALLDENPNPSETEIREALSGNICRCTGYVQIVEAVKLAVKMNAEDKKQSNLFEAAKGGNS
jgi:carbon-monoxide dehydrogenase small subunit